MLVNTREETLILRFTFYRAIMQKHAFIMKLLLSWIQMTTLWNKIWQSCNALRKEVKSKLKQNKNIFTVKATHQRENVKESNLC